MLRLNDGRFRNLFIEQTTLTVSKRAGKSGAGKKMPLAQETPPGSLRWDLFWLSSLRDLI
jgi:hypothetical protein